MMDDGWFTKELQRFGQQERTGQIPSPSLADENFQGQIGRTEMSLDFGNLSTHSRAPSVTRDQEENDDEEALVEWAAIERLPTYKRVHTGILHGVAGANREYDLRRLGFEDRRELLDRLIKNAESNEQFLKKLKKRIDRVCLPLPTIEVRFQNLCVEGEAFVGSRALPSIPNFFLNIFENLGNFLHIIPSHKKRFSILSDVSGIVKPGRMTLLLGPPSSGKTTLLKALSGKLDSSLKFSGEVTYNGHSMCEFTPQRTSAYVDQFDIHIPELTVRETLAFAAKCQGVGSAYDMLVELLRREKLLNVTPDPYIDAYMKASVLKGNKEDIATEYIIRILGLDVCADSKIGNTMVRGISGGQRKRVTTGELLVGPVNAFFMDEISTGLDSSTTFQIVNSIRQSIQIFRKTALISLLQPPPETFELFDDIIVISEGQIVYQGPREHVLEFFESMGFRCPERKAVADFLQEVISRKDQRQYWVKEERHYRYVSVPEFAEGFRAFHIGKAIECKLATPFDRSKNHPAALVTSKYGADKKELFKSCFLRELILMKRNTYFNIFKLIQLEISAIIVATVFVQMGKHRDSPEDGTVRLGAIYFSIYLILFSGFNELPVTISRLPVFYKQRDLCFYPSWAYALPSILVGIPVSMIEVALWVVTIYHTAGFDPSFISFLKHYILLSLNGHMAYALFRFIAVLSRNDLVANISSSIFLVWLFLFGGFILSKENMKMAWAFWTSPLMYSQNALSINEFLGSSWRKVLNGTKETLGVTVLKSHGMFTDPSWFWIGVGSLIGFMLLFNLVFTLALIYLREEQGPQAHLLTEEVMEKKHRDSLDKAEATRTMEDNEAIIDNQSSGNKRRGLLLPFQPLSVTFENVTYSVDMPKEIKLQGATENRLLLLKGVSGAFRPGVLTALMGVSGAGKTTLMDVLAGRKNTGYIDGVITVSGYLKRQETFLRVSGYCEQNDIHSPHVTIYESLMYSAWLRLPVEVDEKTRKLFIEEVMDLVELAPLKDTLVGYPTNGISIDQRKRLTIAVELVANPSIIFMDEPTSGLDSRAAAVVMRTIRSTVDTGRTVVCTIHQPSIDVFEAFDELFLLTQGGEEIYVGPLGLHSCKMIKYFEGIKGIRQMEDNYNASNWMLEVTTRAQEERLGVRFAEIYKQSELYRRNKALIRELSRPSPGGQDLHFHSKYPLSYHSQFKACLWKLNKSYWRNTRYNGFRFVFTFLIAIVLGVVFSGVGTKRKTRLDVSNALGAMQVAVMFMGAQCAAAVRPAVIAERIVYYRERAAGMYSSFPYTFAQVVIEIPYATIQVLFYAIITYSMLGYEWIPSKFLMYVFFMWITVIYFTYYGMMVVAISPNQETAAVLTGFIYTIWTLFAGFVIPHKSIAVWWKWYTWLCPVSWSLYAVATSQFGAIQDKLDSGETVAEFMSNFYGYEYGNLWQAPLVLIGFAVLFVFVYTTSTKALNFQKR